MTSVRKGISGTTGILMLYNNSSQSNLGTASRSRTTMQLSPHCFLWDAPHLLPKLALPLWQSTPPSNTPILNRPHSPFQMAFGSSQPFCHSTLSGQTDTDTHTHRLTDGISNRSMLIVLMLYSIAKERRANNITFWLSLLCFCIVRNWLGSRRSNRRCCRHARFCFLSIKYMLL